MPLYPISFDRLPILETVFLTRLWNQLSSAINFFHQHNFIHMDIKPSNILITTTGDFILAELGSVVHDGERSESTQAYLPIEMWDPIDNRGPIASRSVDWWMFAVVLYEKACGGEIGSFPPTKHAVRDRIAGTLNLQYVVTLLLSHLNE